LGDTGPEQSALALSKTPSVQEGGTNSGTLNSESTSSDPDKAYLDKRWPRLHPAVKEQIMGILRSTMDKE
jgi:hypothetical protein